MKTMTMMTKSRNFSPLGFAEIFLPAAARILKQHFTRLLCGMFSLEIIEYLSCTLCTVLTL